MSIAPADSPGITDALVKRCLFLRGDEEERAWEYLLSPENVETTVALLTGMLMQVDNDLAVRGAYKDADYAEWRRKALGFKRAVSRRLPPARALLKQHNRARSVEEFTSARGVLRELVLAVINHERASTDADIKPEPHDLDLWRALDQLCLPVGHDIYTLRGMIDEGVWV